MNGASESAYTFPSGSARWNQETTAALTGGVKGTGTLTLENAALIGTLDYLAPEQAVNFHEADIRADIYSLGCSLHYLLTGRPPFADGTLADKLLRHGVVTSSSVNARILATHGKWEWKEQSEKQPSPETSLQEKQWQPKQAHRLILPSPSTVRDAEPEAVSPCRLVILPPAFTQQGADRSSDERTGWV
ncbi:hypothetical protein AYO44_05975 [Planctomycetaceae bacterium SCGC AG-212-F19]|nr:hypothetical protein AYO44_05975 [Planctomycetaceae bacterium SCGC AG-212-F19]